MQKQKMNIRPFFILILICLVFVAVPGVRARVYIDIDSPGFRKFPLAIADFRQVGGDGDPGSLALWFPREAARYLEMTDYFQIKDRRAFLEPSGWHPTDPFQVQFPDWTAIGVDYLVKGIFTQRATVLTTEIRIYDTIRMKEVFRKTYTGINDDKSLLARKMAGDILTALTGATPLFDTKIAFTRKKGNTAEIHTIPFDGSFVARLTSEYALVVSPHWSPDGRYLSYTSYRSGIQEVYIKDLKRKITRKVTPYAGMNLAGPWSPDGRKMLLTLSKDGNEEIYSLEIATGALKRLTMHFGIDVSPTWSPDGRRIAFVSNRSGGPQIYVMDAEGGVARRITYEGGYNTSPAWSPRGDRIAFEGRTAGGFQIFTITPEGEDLRVVTSAAGGSYEKPVWSPDGRYLAAVARQGGRYRISVISLNSKAERVIHETAQKCHGLSWSP